MVFFIVNSHAFACYFLHGLWSDDFVNGQENGPSVQKRNFHWFAEYGILQSYLLSIHQVSSASTVTAGDVVICTLWIWRSGHKVYVKVGSWTPRLLVAFASKLLVVVWVHSSFNFNLLVANRLTSCLAVEADSLFLVTYCFDASRIEFLKCSWHLNLHCWHWRQLWLVDTSVGGAEETTFNLSAASVAYIVERVIFQEVTIKYLVAILLVNVSTMMGALLVFNTSTEYVFAILIVNRFPLRTAENFIGFTNLMEFFKMNLHIIWMFQRMIFECKFFEMC